MVNAHIKAAVRPECCFKLRGWPLPGLAENPCHVFPDLSMSVLSKWWPTV